MLTENWSPFVYKMMRVPRFDHLVHPWFFIFFNSILCIIFLAMILISCLLRLWWSSWISLRRWPLGNHHHPLLHIVFPKRMSFLKILNFLNFFQKKKLIAFLDLCLMIEYFLVLIRFIHFQLEFLHFKLIILMVF